MAELLLAEEFLLIALDDEKGTISSNVAVEPGLAGALLLDLIASGSLVETGDALAVDHERDGPSHQLLADALNTIRGQAEPKKAKHWVDKLPKELKPIKGRVAASLVSRGALAEQRHKTLGLVPATRYPQADPRAERELRRRLEAALLQGVEPEPRTAHLVVLMHAVGLVAGVVPKDQRKAAKARAKEIAESSVVGAAVKRAVNEIQAAVTMAAMTGAIVSGASS